MSNRNILQYYHLHLDPATPPTRQKRTTQDDDYELPTLRKRPKRPKWAKLSKLWSKLSNTPEWSEDAGSIDQVTQPLSKRPNIPEDDVLAYNFYNNEFDSDDELPLASLPKKEGIK